MDLFVSKLISSAVQIVLFSALPFVWWLLTARKKESFSRWIGLKKPKKRSGNGIVKLCVSATLVFMLIGVFAVKQVGGAKTAAGGFYGMGASALPAVLVYGIFNTALPEEILFRGFFLKRFAARLGVFKANIVQALAFGLLHAWMFYAVVGTGKAVLIMIFTGAVAWMLGYVNEMKADGSILPGWAIHAVSNIFTGILTAFSII